MGQPRPGIIKKKGNFWFWYTLMNLIWNFDTKQSKINGAVVKIIFTVKIATLVIA